MALARTNPFALPPQRRWTAGIQAAARKFGYDIQRAQPPRFGDDPDYDLAEYLQDTPTPLVLDVGANKGQSVFRFKELLPRSVIHAFEPGPMAFGVLKSYAEGLENVTLVNAAVGSAEGTSVLLERESTVMSSILRPGEAAPGTVLAETPVQTTTVDAYCAAHGISYVDLLKTDTQGYELEVLRGCSDLMAANRIRLVTMEVIFSEMYEGIPPFDEVYRFLVDRGFSLVTFYGMVIADRLASWSDCLFANPSFTSE